MPATVEVWDLPLRLYHWMLAAAVLIAYFTANVFDTVHEVAGYAALALISFRLVWGFYGSRYSCFRSFIRPLRTVAPFVRQLARGRVGHYLGLNPAGALMALTLLVSLAVSTISGWMQLTETYFGVAWVEAVHAYSSELVLILAVVHVLGVLAMSAVQRENLVRAMLTGRKRRLRGRGDL